MSEPRPLDYDTPPELPGVQVRWRDDLVEVEMDPLSGSLYAGLLAMETVLAVLVAALFFGRSPSSVVMFSLVLGAGTIRFAWTFRHARSTPRRVWASPRGIGWSDLFRRSGEQIVELEKYSPIEIGLCWFAPWAYSLKLSPKVPLDFLKRSPKFLFYDGDFDRIGRIAALLEEVRNLPIDHRHIRGAFEVVVKSSNEGENA